MRPVGRACSPGSGCATTLHRRSMGLSVKAQTLRHKCARRNSVQVRAEATAGHLQEALRESVIITIIETSLPVPPVDGKWSSWVSWGACSVSCGGGTRQRTRLCASPAPQHGGRQCEGSDVHIDFCNSDPCPSESRSLLPIPLSYQTLHHLKGDCKGIYLYHSSCLLLQSVVTGVHGVAGAAAVRHVTGVR